MLSLRPSRLSSYAFLAQIAKLFSAREMRSLLSVQWMLMLVYCVTQMAMYRFERARL